MDEEKNKSQKNELLAIFETFPEDLAGPNRLNVFLASPILLFDHGLALAAMRKWKFDLGLLIDNFQDFVDLGIGDIPLWDWLEYFRNEMNPLIAEQPEQPIVKQLILPSVEVFKKIQDPKTGTLRWKDEVFTPAKLLMHGEIGRLILGDKCRDAVRNEIFDHCRYVLDTKESNLEERFRHREAFLGDLENIPTTQSLKDIGIWEILDESEKLPLSVFKEVRNQLKPLNFRDDHAFLKEIEDAFKSGFPKMFDCARLLDLYDKAWVSGFGKSGDLVHSLIRRILQNHKSVDVWSVEHQFWYEGTIHELTESFYGMSFKRLREGLGLSLPKTGFDDDLEFLLLAAAFLRQIDHWAAKKSLSKISILGRCDLTMTLNPTAKEICEFVKFSAWTVLMGPLRENFEKHQGDILLGFEVVKEDKSGYVYTDNFFSNNDFYFLRDIVESKTPPHNKNNRRAAIRFATRALLKAIEYQRNLECKKNESRS